MIPDPVEIARQLLAGATVDGLTLREAFDNRFNAPADPAVLAEAVARLGGPDDAAATLAALLLAPAYDLPPLPPLSAIPPDIADVYVAGLVTAPPLFLRLGEADRFAEHLSAVLPAIEEAILADPVPARQIAALHGAQHVFSLLLYFNERDLRDVMACRARLIERHAALNGVKTAEPIPPRPRRAVLKVGIIMPVVRPRPETFAMLALVSDRPADVELTLFVTHRSGHPLEAWCQQHGATLHLLPDALIDKAAALRAAEQDVLFYATNVTAGWTHFTALSCCRLAPVQATSIASMMTTGSRHMDLYLSGVLTDPDPLAADTYTETLIRLPGTAHCFAYGTEVEPPSEPPPRTGAEILETGEPAITFASTANMYKIIPELQRTWARILAAVPGSRLLLFPYGPNWNSRYPEQQFTEGLYARFEEHGVSRDRLTLVSESGLNRDDIRRRLQAGADIYLDSYPFSGSTSLIEPLEAAMPIVARRGVRLRGTMAAAMLTVLKVPDLAAWSEDEYVDLAVRLATSPEARADASAALRAGMLKGPSFLRPATYAAAVYDVFRRVMPA